MGLSAAAALHQLGSLADGLAHVDAVLLDEEVAGGAGQQRFAVIDRADDHKGVLHLGAQLEGDVLHGLGGQDGLAADDTHAVFLLGGAQQLGLVGLCFLVDELLGLLLHAGVLADETLDGSVHVGDAIEELAQLFHAVLQLVECFLHLLTGDGLDAADTGSDAALAHNLEHPDLTRSLHVAAAAELHALPELHHAHVVAVFLAEEGDGAELLGLLDGDVAMVLQGDVLADAGIDDALHLAQLLGCHLLEVAEVKAQAFGRNERAFLLYMCAKHLAKGLIQQVRGAVVGLAGVTLVSIHASHEIGFGVFGQLLGDVHGEAVLALRVDDVDGLKLADDDALVAHLSAHLGIERCLVQHNLVVGLLLLHDAAVAQDAAFVFSVVPAYELTLGGRTAEHILPVIGLHGGGIAGALLLLLHLGVETGFIHGEVVLAADELGEVEGEAVGVEEREGFGAADLALAGGLRVGHHLVEELDARLQRAQEALFLFLHHLVDEFALCHQLGVGLAHLLSERGQQQVHERALLTQECVGVAHSTAQDATDDIARLGVGGQLAVGNGEGHGTDVVGDDAHGDVHVLTLAVLLAGELLDGFDSGLEHVGVVVGVLTLQGADETLEPHTGVDDVHA